MSTSDTIQALYSVAYKIKFWMKANKHFDYVVPPLEGLWWADDPSDFINGNRDEWRWTMMIMQPESVTQEVVDLTVSAVATKKDAPSVTRKVPNHYSATNVLADIE